VIVLDASSALYGLLNDGDARRVLATEAVVVPHLIDSELAHALRGQLLRGSITEADARQRIETWRRLGMERVSGVGLLPRIWELKNNLSGYDATYVALAEALDCSLVTADRRIGAAPGPTCPITLVRS
jgi:predicted nucleic acid-binding protein